MPEVGPVVCRELGAAPSRGSVRNAQLPTATPRVEGIRLALAREAQAEIPPAAADHAAVEALLKVCRVAGIDSAEDVSLLRMVLLNRFSYSEAGEALGGSETAPSRRAPRVD